MTDVLAGSTPEPLRPPELARSLHQYHHAVGLIIEVIAGLRTLAGTLEQSRRVRVQVLADEPVDVDVIRDRLVEALDADTAFAALTQQVHDAQEAVAAAYLALAELRGCQRIPVRLLGQVVDVAVDAHQIERGLAMSTPALHKIRTELAAARQCLETATLSPHGQPLVAEAVAAVGAARNTALAAAHLLDAVLPDPATRERVARTLAAEAGRLAPTSASDTG